MVVVGLVRRTPDSGAIVIPRQVAAACWGGWVGGTVGLGVSVCLSPGSGVAVRLVVEV